MIDGTPHATSHGSNTDFTDSLFERCQAHIQSCRGIPTFTGLQLASGIPINLVLYNLACLQRGLPPYGAKPSLRKKATNKPLHITPRVTRTAAKALRARERKEPAAGSKLKKARGAPTPKKKPVKSKKRSAAPKPPRFVEVSTSSLSGNLRGQSWVVKHMGGSITKQFDENGTFEWDQVVTAVVNATEPFRVGTGFSKTTLQKISRKHTFITYIEKTAPPWAHLFK